MCILYIYNIYNIYIIIYIKFFQISLNIFKVIIEELHILLTPNKEHKKVFPNVPVIQFWNGKSLKNYLVRATSHL